VNYFLNDNSVILSYLLRRKKRIAGSFTAFSTMTNLNLEIPTPLMKILKKMDLLSKRDRSRNNVDRLIEPDAMGLSYFS
jgi:hypothetical protein